MCRGAPQAGKGLVPPLVHLLLSGGPSDQARAARALSNMATDSSVKDQIVAAGMYQFPAEFMGPSTTQVVELVEQLEHLVGCQSLETHQPKTFQSTMLYAIQAQFPS